MAWDDFIECMGDAGTRLVDAGEDAVREAANLWKMIPQDIKLYLAAAARYGGQYVVAALEAVGIAIADVLVAAGAGFGFGYFMAALVDCADQHL